LRRPPGVELGRLTATSPGIDRDNYFALFDAPQDTSLARLQGFVREVHVVSPKTRVIIPQYFKPIVIPPLPQ
jgi:hypothetical protein